MKNLILFFLLFGQAYMSAQTIAPAPADKAVVYFVRPSTMGLVVNFMYFDNDKVIGKFNGNKYLRYECEPGEHLFWARSESISLVRGNLEAGKIYMIEARPQMGVMVAGVKLVPINSADYKMKKIKKLLAKKESVELTEEKQMSLQKQVVDTIERGLKKAKKNEDKIEVLSGFSFLPEDLEM